MKAIKCKIRLHGYYKEILTDKFDSINKAKEWIKSCWDKPYTIVKL
jgi:hypothetical protein